MTEYRQRNGLRPVSKASGLSVDEPGRARSSRASRTKLRSFSRSLPMALLRAREAVMRQFRPMLRHYGITEQQWRVLRALTAVKDIEVLALAKSTFLLPPSLSRILRDLEGRKLIQRRASRDDLRRGLVSITPKGLALIERAGVNSEKIYAEITRCYGAKRLRALYDLLDELELELERLGGVDELEFE